MNYVIETNVVDLRPDQCWDQDVNAGIEDLNAGWIKPQQHFQVYTGLGSSSFPLAKQDSKSSKECIFQLFSTDSETTPLDSYTKF